MPGTNPYTFGDPVGKSPSFVGREDILKDVLRVLRHPEQNAITLYGQRRIGKTSILQYLEIHLPENGPFIPIYFDLMDRSGLPLGEILRQMACIIAQKLNQPDPDLGDNQEQSFRDAYLPNTLHNLPAEASLVFLLDEFDVLADPQAEQQAKRQFYSYMRDLRQLNPARLQTPAANSPRRQAVNGLAHRTRGAQAPHWAGRIAPRGARGALQRPFSSEPGRKRPGKIAAQAGIHSTGLQCALFLEARFTARAEPFSQREGSIRSRGKRELWHLRTGAHLETYGRGWRTACATAG